MRLSGSFFFILSIAAAGVPLSAESTDRISLPPLRSESPVSVEAALRQRRSVRSFADRSLSPAEIGQLLWAAQGVTGPRGQRTAPSAGARYPLELLLVAGRIDGLEAGVYRYSPADHSLTRVLSGDLRSELTVAAHGQRWIGAAPGMMVIAAVPSRTAARYGSRADRYVAMEVGAVVQNIQLQGISLGIGSTFVGAFDDTVLKSHLKLAEDEHPLAVVPLGGIRDK